MLSALGVGCADDGGAPAGGSDVADGDVTGSGDIPTGDTSGDAGRDGASGTDADDEPVVVDTYANFAAGFMTSYCTSCHEPDGVAARVDLTTYGGVTAYADTIRCGTSPVQLDDCPDRGVPYEPRFPVGTGPRPSTEERQRLVDWIDAGLPE